MLLRRPVRPFRAFALAAALLLSIVAATSASAGPPMAMTAPEITDAWAHETGDLAPDPSVVFGRLENGMGYVLRHNEEPRNRVAVHLFVNTGALHETDPEQGLAHFLEHMAFDGSEHFPPGELVKYFQSIGMKFGPDANAHTAYAETVYDVLLPDGKADTIRGGLRVMRDYAAGAILAPEQIEKEKKVVLAEMTTRDTASYRTWKAAVNFEAPDARISKRFPIGTEQAIRGFDRKIVKAFYDAWYRPDNMALVMVGDFDPESVRPLIEEAFGDLAPRAPARKPPAFGTILHAGLQAFHHFEPETGNTSVSIETLRQIPPAKDTKAFRVARLYRDMADRIVNERLSARLREPDAPFTAASVDSGVFLREIFSTELSADCAPENWEATLAEMEKTLRQALRFGFLDSEVDRVKKDFIADYENGVKQAATRSSRRLSRWYLWSVANHRVIRSPEQEAQDMIPAIEAVSATDLHRVFVEAWGTAHRLVLVTGDAKIPDPDPAARIRGAFLDSAAQPVSPPESETATEFPYLDPPARPGKIVARESLEDLGVERIRYENGVVLQLKKTDFKADAFSVSIEFGNGRSGEPARLAGLSGLAGPVVNESGIGRLDSEQLDRALAGKTVSAAFRVAEDHFAVNGSGVPAETELLFQLLYHRLKDPAFRESAFSLVKKRLEQDYRELSRSVEGAVQLKAQRFLAGGDPRFGIPGEEEIARLTLDDVKRWVASAMAATDLEISVVGDFDPETVIELAGRYFGGLPAHPVGSEQAARPGPRFPEGGRLDIPVDTEIDKGMVIVAWPTADQWNIGRTRRLGMLSEIFSDRLRLNVREALGASYAQYAYNHPSRAYEGYGTLRAVAVIDPADADKVAAAILETARGLAEAPVPEEELVRIKEPVITGIRDLRRTNGYWSGSVLTGASRHPEQLEWSRTISGDYAAITAAEVHEMAKTFLKPEKAAVIRIFPAQGKK